MRILIIGEVEIVHNNLDTGDNVTIVEELEAGELINSNGYDLIIRMKHDRKPDAS